MINWIRQIPNLLEFQTSFVELLLTNIRYLQKLIKRDGSISMEVLRQPVFDIFSLKTDKYSRSPLQILEHSFSPFFIQLRKFSSQQFQIYFDDVSSFRQLSDKLDVCIAYISEIFISNDELVINIADLVKINKTIGHALHHIGQFEFILSISREIDY